MGRDRGPEPQDTGRGQTHGDSRARRHVCGWTCVCGPEPDPAIRPRGTYAVATSLCHRARVPRPVTLGPAADDGTRSAGGARTAGDLPGLVERRRSRMLAGAVVGLAMVVSFFELAIHPAQDRFRTVPIPPEYSAVRATPPGILAEYPLGYSDIYRLWQSRHGRPILNGALPETPPDYVRLGLLDPAAPGTAAALSLLGVTAVAIHPYAHVDAEIAPREPRGSAGYKLVGRFPDAATVWQVVARPAPALVALTGGFAKPQLLQTKAVVFAFTSSSGVGVIDLDAKQPGVIRLRLRRDTTEGQAERAASRGLEERTGLHTQRPHSHLDSGRDPARTLSTPRQDGSATRVGGRRDRVVDATCGAELRQSGAARRPDFARSGLLKVDGAEAAFSPDVPRVGRRSLGRRSPPARSSSAMARSRRPRVAGPAGGPTGVSRLPR